MQYRTLGVTLLGCVLDAGATGCTVPKEKHNSLSAGLSSAPRVVVSYITSCPCALGNGAPREHATPPDPARRRALRGTPYYPRSRGRLCAREFAHTIHHPAHTRVYLVWHAGVTQVEVHNTRTARARAHTHTHTHAHAHTHTHTLGGIVLSAVVWWCVFVLA